MITFLQLAGGLVLLTVGAEALVRGASRLAAAAGISPLVVGLTVVAFGTSAPELAVSTASALGGQADIALGNVVGSNIFNVLFILGLSALVAPLRVSVQLIRLDVPLMIGVSVALLLLGLDGRVGRIEGAILFAALLLYTAFLIRQSRRESLARAEDGAGDPGSGRSKALDAGLVLFGLALLVLGSRWLVAAAVAMAQRMGIGELVIGLTIVAAGTSLPELATSLVASLRGERDIAVGNVVGSNIFNILGVLGLSSLISPTGVAVAAAALVADIPVMLAVAVACLPIFFTGHEIARWEGGVFVAYYVAYTVWLVLAATGSPVREPFGFVLGAFVLPLTMLTLAVLAWRSWRARTG